MGFFGCFCRCKYILHHVVKMMDYVTPLMVAKLNIFFGLVNFLQTYVSPETAIKQFFTVREPKGEARKMALYLMTFTGQHDVPWIAMSIAVWYSGNVSKEYLLASAVNAGF